MISDIIKVGMNLELFQETESKEENTIPGVVYSSKIQDIFPNGDLEIDMPMYQRKLVLLHNGVRYHVVFYSQNSTYTAIAEVVDRYKSGNMYLLRIALKTQPVKFQRREFFRCDCMVELSLHELKIDDTDIKNLAVILEQERLKDPEHDWKNGLALDISGGGVRFISKEELEVGSYKRFQFELATDGKIRNFDVIGVILSCKRLPDSSVKYENRVKFVYLTNADREEIIRFIFEEERKTRKLSR